MATAGEETAKAVGDLLKRILDAMEKAMKDKAQQAAASKQYAYARALDEYVKGGGEIKGYIYNDELLLKHLKEELKSRDVPFIEYSINGQKIVAIRESDEELYNQVLQETKQNEQRYFQILSKEEMAKSIENAQRLSDEEKEFLTLDGLDNTMAQMLANKCNDITRGFMVGVDVNDSTTDFMVHTRQTIVLGEPKNDKVYSQDFCRAYLAATFSGYGPNHEKNAEQLKIDEKLNKKIKNFKGPGEMWITGQDDTDTVLKVTENGYERIGVTPMPDTNGQLRFVYNILERHSSSEPDYRKNLDVSLAGIFDECVMSSKAEVDAHIQGIEKQHSERPQKTKEEKQRSYNETVICDKADYLIKETLNKTPFFKDKSADLQFDDYRQMAHQLFEGVLVNNRPVWIEATKFEGFKALCEDKVFDVTEYMEGIDKAMNYQNVQKKRAKQIMREQQEKQRQAEQERKRKHDRGKSQREEEREV